MKRNLDLCREILLYIESRTNFAYTSLFGHEFIIDGKPVDEDIVTLHVLLLTDAGYIENVHGLSFCSAQRITWDGYEILDKIRSPERWAIIKEAMNTIGGFSLSCLDSPDVAEKLDCLVRTKQEQANGTGD